MATGRSVTVRPADARDAAACAAVYAPYVTDSAISFEEVPPDAAEMARRVEAAHVWLVAETDGAVVGYAYASPHRDRAAYRWAADVAVYVDAAFQRAGVGRALYDELLARVRDGGIRTVCAGITLPNPASERLHPSFGFEPVGTYRRIGWKVGAWHDVAWYQLDLGGDEPPTELRFAAHASGA